MNISLFGWAIFAVLVLVALAFDLGLLSGSRRRAAPLSLRAATLRSVAWVTLAVLFGLGIALVYGRAAGLTFFTAYLLEESLSVDNIFVFVLIFSTLQIPADQQRGVLLWGVLGALVSRALLIAAGLYVLNRFHWLVYPFGALIIFAAVRLLFGERKEREVVVAACSVRAPIGSSAAG